MVVSTACVWHRTLQQDRSSPANISNLKESGGKSRSLGFLMERASVLTNVLRYECWQPSRAELCPGWDFPVWQQKRLQRHQWRSPPKDASHCWSMINNFYCAGCLETFESFLSCSPPKKWVHGGDGSQPNTQTGLPMLYDSKTALHHIKDRLWSPPWKVSCSYFSGQTSFFSFTLLEGINCLINLSKNNADKLE